MAQRELDIGAVRLGLGLPGEEWLAELAQFPPADRSGAFAAGPPELPDPRLAGEALVRLGVPAADLAPALASMPDPRRTPELWWLLEHCYRVLFRDPDDTRPVRPAPDLPAVLGPAGRYFYLHVFLAALPVTRRLHDELGIPAEVSWRTLADVGAKMVVHRRERGVGGLDRQNWLIRHFRGTLYQLNRLQYERIRLRPDETAGSPLAVGPALNIHIPAEDPLSPDSCDESLRSARAFFARYFPQERYPVAVCRSWLLDDQLAEYLPASANIIQFQRRFQPYGPSADGDRDVFRFVFGSEPVNVDGLPQETTLQRAVVAHLRSGRHWRVRTGHLSL
jgi:hypothetical protein